MSLVGSFISTLRDNSVDALAHQATPYCLNIASIDDEF